MYHTVDHPNQVDTKCSHATSPYDLNIRLCSTILSVEYASISHMLYTTMAISDSSQERSKMCRLITLSVVKHDWMLMVSGA